MCNSDRHFDRSCEQCATAAALLVEARPWQPHKVQSGRRLGLTTAQTHDVRREQDVSRAFGVNDMAESC